MTDSGKRAGNVKANLARATWRKSSYSGGSGNCVEIAGNLPGGVGVRDSKDPSGPALIFTSRAWRAFIAGVKNGEYNPQ
ncbi:MAG TPA: DUF397 domain-containing protein [Streptosporangiaceae bacterium]|nr:DUF397 domain-containing protein [Streptosporangiaceae bacterium]